MFKKGEYIVYGTTGVCRIEDITTMNMNGNDRLYYVLVPHNQKGSKIFTPVDNQKTMMRRILSKEEAEQLIKDIPQIEELWISDEKMREMEYKNCMKNCECREWIKIIKALYVRKQERIANKKKVTSTDEKYLKLAEDNLYSELSIPLGIPKEEIEAYLIQRIERLLQ